MYSFFIYFSIFSRYIVSIITNNSFFIYLSYIINIYIFIITKNYVYFKHIINNFFKINIQINIQYDPVIWLMILKFQKKEKEKKDLEKNYKFNVN